MMHRCCRELRWKESVSTPWSSRPHKEGNLKLLKAGSNFLCTVCMTSSIHKSALHLQSRVEQLKQFTRETIQLVQMRIAMRQGDEMEYLDSDDLTRKNWSAGRGNMISGLKTKVNDGVVVITGITKKPATII